MRYVDARRLTGPNHLARHPLVQVELALDPGDAPAPASAAYRRELARMRVALGFPADVSGLIERPHRGGMVIAYVEPIDVMLACTETSEWAAMSASEEMAGRPALSLEPKRAEIEAILARDRSPRLVALEAAARGRGVPFLWDDDEVSLGHGARSVTWPRGALPDVTDVPWERLGPVPVALVTGTNGKTTSTRWLGRVAREAGRRVGVTSSDAITIGDEVVSSGDWTGPAAARVVLRRHDVELAVLETARGGILRRGLAVDACDVALMTNITDDHLGSYGIDDLDAMTDVKAVTAEAARGSGAVILNAADPRLLARAARFEDTRVILFGDLESAPQAALALSQHRARGGEIVVAKEGRLVRARGSEPETTLATIDEIPLTFRGAARFNVANALGVIGAATALGLPDDAIRRALVGFTPAENPRRTALVERAGVRVLLDFGHNPDGIRAVMTLVRELRAGSSGRLFVCLGSAGDRTDHELDEMARILAEARPHRILLREMADYLRGRELGEVPAFFRRAFLAYGMTEGALGLAASEVDSLRTALAEARPGDFVVLLVHLDHDAVGELLA